MNGDQVGLSRREAIGVLGLATVAAAAQTPTDISTVTGIAEAVQKRKVSAVEVLQKYLGEIERSNTELNAFVYLDADGALKQAKSIDDRVAKGEDVGPLAGVPLGIKDLENCAGMPTSQGSLLYKGQPAVKDDSPHVAKARRAGAVMVGKTAAPEFGMHSITASRAWGVTRNPWDKSRSPGGSSGGSSAALASGMIPLATGSDGGGSIRSPAAFTGLVGLKASHGRIGRAHAGDTSTSGCLSLTVRDTARFLDVAAGPTPFDRTSLQPPAVRYEQAMETLDVAGLRAAWSSDYGSIPTETECIDVARHAAEVLVRAGKLRWVERPFNPPNPYPAWIASAMMQLRGELELDGIWPAKKDQLTERLAWRVSNLKDFTLADLARADRARAELERQTALLFEDVDVLLTPVTTVVSLPAEGPIPETVAGRDARNTGAEAHLMLANMCWLPAISVPAGLSASGFPIGLQIVCPRWRDDMALRLARIMELAQPWPHRAPAYRNV
jgi:aspartyl-tRNA(Asn)/glutamyl-tRNA(Gln) amidotransferase subunit A